jgi:beta-glucosidase
VPVWIDDPRDAGCSNGPSDTNLCGLDGPAADQVIAEFGNFAAKLAQTFGDRVDEWGTINEPVNWLVASYGIGSFPPGRVHLFNLLDKFVPLMRNYLAAHAAMYHAIKANDTIDADGDGSAADVGFSISVADWIPAKDNKESTDPMDTAARDKLVYVFHHLVVDAVTQGKFDADLDGTLEEDHPDWKGTIDWLGLQYYFRAGVTGHNGLLPAPLDLTPCFFGFDLGACLHPPDATLCVPTMGYESYADGLTDILEDFSSRYPGLPLVVSEAGIATGVGARRAENVVRILEAIDRARAAGVDVRGYYHWSLFDNYEWGSFAPRFGLYTVDFSSYARSATEGADVYGAIAGARKLTAAQREKYGGDGPMTPEPGIADTVPFCYGLPQ